MRITDRDLVLEQIDRCAARNVPMLTACCDSVMNVEANLKAAKEIGIQYGIDHIPIRMSVTHEYESMSQTDRFFECGTKEEGLRLFFSVLEILCGEKGSTFYDVNAIPHLDHADSRKEEWVWRKYIDSWGSVMVDGSLDDRTLDENKTLTRQMVDQYGTHIVIEGALQRPTVAGHHKAKKIDPHECAQSAHQYVLETGVDLVVVSLGSAQQSPGWAKYRPEVAKQVTEALGKPMMVIHGGSSIRRSEQKNLGYHGIVGFNMWTRAAREAAKAAAKATHDHRHEIAKGDPGQVYSTIYTGAHVNKQADIWKRVMRSLGYERLGRDYKP